MILDLDRSSWSHLSLALRLHRRWCRENVVPVPADIVRLSDLAAEYDSDRPQPTNEQGSVDPVHTATMQPKLTATYAAASARIGVSKRTVERLVAAGTLPTVDIGGTRRIRITDLDAYAAGLAPVHRNFRDDITTVNPLARGTRASRGQDCPCSQPHAICSVDDGSAASRVSAYSARGGRPTLTN